MTKQEIYEQLKTLWEQFDTNHNKTTKKSDADARKALGEIKKLVTPYRAASVNEAKGEQQFSQFIVSFPCFIKQGGGSSTIPVDPKESTQY